MLESSDTIDFITERDGITRLHMAADNERTDIAVADAVRAKLAHYVASIHNGDVAAKGHSIDRPRIVVHLAAPPDGDLQKVLKLAAIDEPTGNVEWAMTVGTSRDEMWDGRPL